MTGGSLRHPVLPSYQRTRCYCRRDRIARGPILCGLGLKKIAVVRQNDSFATMASRLIVLAERHLEPVTDCSSSATP